MNDDYTINDKNSYYNNLYLCIIYREDDAKQSLQTVAFIQLHQINNT